jgi:hypothetical protein
MENKMNRLIKNMFAVIVIALLISLAAAAMGNMSLAIPCGTCGSTYADPNEPGNLPEMTPNYLNLNVIAEDSNEPDPMPEMVPNRMGLNVISQDPNEEPAEMVSNI